MVLHFNLENNFPLLPELFIKFHFSILQAYPLELTRKISDSLEVVLQAKIIILFPSHKDDI